MNQEADAPFACREKPINPDFLKRSSLLEVRPVPVNR